MRIIPNEEKIVIRPAKKDELTKAGIKLPESSDETNKIGVVVWTHDNETWLSEGDRVIYSGYDEEDVSINGKTYVILELSKILGKIKE